MKRCIGHLRKNDLVGETLAIEIDNLQLQAGVPWPVLSRDGTIVRQYVDQCWVSHTWAYNDEYNLTVRREEAPWLLPQRTGDRFIMEAIADMNETKAIDLKYAQRCRLFLKVTTLADITNLPKPRTTESRGVECLCETTEKMLHDRNDVKHIETTVG